MSDHPESPHQRLDRFTDLLASCQARLVAHAYAMVQNMADAEDICQRSAIVMWQKLDQYQPDTSFSSWALKITQFEALNFIRGRRRDRTYFDDETLNALASAGQASDESASDSARWTALKNCLSKLSDNQKKLVRMYYERPESLKDAGRSTSTIANVALRLGKSEGSVRTALCRIRRILRECVEGMPGEELGQ